VLCGFDRSVIFQDDTQLLLTGTWLQAPNLDGVRGLGIVLVLVYHLRLGIATICTILTFIYLVTRVCWCPVLWLQLQQSISWSKAVLADCVAPSTVTAELRSTVTVEVLLRLWVRW
jgi:hypothetical protein